MIQKDMILQYGSYYIHFSRLALWQRSKISLYFILSHNKAVGSIHSYSWHWCVWGKNNQPLFKWAKGKVMSPKAYLVQVQCERGGFSLDKTEHLGLDLLPSECILRSTATTTTMYTEMSPFSHILALPTQYLNIQMCRNFGDLPPWLLTAFAILFQIQTSCLISGMRFCQLWSRS